MARTSRPPFPRGLDPSNPFPGRRCTTCVYKVCFPHLGAGEKFYYWLSLASCRLSLALLIRTPLLQSVKMCIYCLPWDCVSMCRDACSPEFILEQNHSHSDDVWTTPSSMPPTSLPSAPNNALAKSFHRPIALALLLCCCIVIVVWVTRWFQKPPHDANNETVIELKKSISGHDPSQTYAYLPPPPGTVIYAKNVLIEAQPIHMTSGMLAVRAQRLNETPDLSDQAPDLHPWRRHSHPTPSHGQPAEVKHISLTSKHEQLFHDADLNAIWRRRTIEFN